MNSTLNHGILEKMFFENGITDQPVEMADKQSPTFVDVHELIKALSARIDAVESTPKQLPNFDLLSDAVKTSKPPDEKAVLPDNENKPCDEVMDCTDDFEDQEKGTEINIETETEDFISDDDSQSCGDFETEGDFGVPKRQYSVMHLVLLKENGKYHCAECEFITPKYKTFYSHYRRCHKEMACDMMKRYFEINQQHKASKRSAEATTNVSEENGDKVKYIYRCSLCKFVTLNIKGFKVHTMHKHNKLSYTNVVRYLPITHPKAAVYYKAFLNTLKEGKQRRSVIRIFRRMFYEQNKEKQDVDSSPIKKPDEANGSELDYLMMRCMMCPKTFMYPSFLHKHYSGEHSTCGPGRHNSDKLLHCELCSYTSESYRELHHHFERKHEFFKDKFTISLTDSEPEEDIVEKPKELPNLPLFDEQQIKEYSPPTPEKSDCSSDPPDQDTSFSCDRCSARTVDLESLFNHYKHIHTRNYPKCFSNRIFNEYQQNVVMVELPSANLSPDWVKGWMNESCTRLVVDPIYFCQACDYSSYVFASLTTHYVNRHPKITCSLGSVTIMESNKLELSKPNGVYATLQREVHQCKVCSYSACLFKTMQIHYKKEHPDIVSEDTNYESLISDSFTNWCFKCTKTFDKAHDLISHIEREHLKDVVNFSLYKSGGYQCLLCQKVLSQTADLVEHMAKHEEDYNTWYHQNYIIAYCCSKCRRVFKGKRFMRHHYTRMHVSWNSYIFRDVKVPKRCIDSAERDEVTTDNEMTSNEKDIDTVNIAASETGVTELAEAKEETSDEYAVSATEIKTDDTNNIKSNVSLSRRQYTCHICDLSTRNKLAMKLHMKRFHSRQVTDKFIESLHVTNTGIIENSCSHIPWMRKSPKVFENHVRLRHNVVEPHQCPHCPKCYICEVVLRMHTRKKHKQFRGSKKYIPKTKNVNSVCFSCTHKNIMTRSPDMYKRHVKINHNQVNPFHCPECPKVYVCGSIFTLHLEKIHSFKQAHKIIRNYCRPPQNKIKEPQTQQVVKHSEVLSQSKRPVKKDISSSKDYSNPKSVMVADNEWRCMYCDNVDQLYECYKTLRAHVNKEHPGQNFIRCRWCDHVSKASVENTNHVKIHQHFISKQMQELRQIWRKRRLQSCMWGSQPSKRKSDVPEAMEVNDSVQPNVDSDFSSTQETTSSSIIPLSPPSGDNEKMPRTARKTIKRTTHTTQASKSLMKPETSTRSNLNDGYVVLLDGRLLCKFCDYTTIDRSRALIHIHATHAQLSNFNCRLCAFSGRQYPDVKKHLTEYHKMEKNHHLCIDLSIDIPQEERQRFSSVESNKGSSRQTRRVGFEPAPSIPVARSEPRDSDDPEMDFMRETTSIAYGRAEQTSEKSTGGRQSSSFKVVKRKGNGFNRRSDRFRCKYCDATLPSTYEMEYHMRRHEIGTIEQSNFMEHPWAMPNLHSFAPRFPPHN